MTLDQPERALGAATAAAQGVRCGPSSPVDRHLQPALRREGALPLGDHDFREVTRADVQRLHAGLRSRPAAANYTLCVLGSLYSRIIKDWELAELRNPTTGVRRFRTRRVERFLTPEDHAAWQRIPAEFGRSTTCWRWFQRWESDGTWAEIVERVG